ncbi:hypothetical protein H696_02236 [Fonticula alba]|uniref:Uncharacterized protein n=1 Tax=Fonticula alba TaxID=691883 RepID=A0A058ZAF1_FONAL|nr:hypothetical protein H696_02236 [Fonticula alba]KCV71290.1 hypothetical protein H696_02236 [Fonticula alba]|eukprot:XP_009494413.1 hypothetical protein H696_02236 [Fonticula alba]
MCSRSNGAYVAQQLGTQARLGLVSSNALNFGEGVSDLDADLNILLFQTSPDERALCLGDDEGTCTSTDGYSTPMAPAEEADLSRSAVATFSAASQPECFRFVDFARAEERHVARRLEGTLLQAAACAHPKDGCAPGVI